MGRKKIGVLGGTFDPIHLGHLIVAEEARTKLKLEKVLFITAGNPWLKDEVISSAYHRVSMVEKAVEDNPYFLSSSLEIDRPGPSYSVDTISSLRETLGEGGEIFFILGWDAVAGLHRWKDPRRLVKMCHLVVVERPGYPLPNVETLQAEIPGIRDSLLPLLTPEVGVSSSDVRQRIAQGLSVRYLIPLKVEEYIREQGLYRGG
jgi:nicotinate-nucleotide adenylyltransferase